MSHLSRLRAALAKKPGIDALLITSEVNQRWVTGFPFTDGLVVVTAGRAVLLTDFRYIEAACASPAAAEFEILMPAEKMYTAAYGIIRETGAANIAIEEATLPVAAADALRATFEGCNITEGASLLIDGLRAFKDVEETEKMKKAQAVTDSAFAHIIEWLDPGRTELEVALEIEFFMRAHGAESTAFDTIAVSGKASSMPHGVPRDVKLEKGFLTMDFGARYDGYCSDMTRTVVIGKADAEMRRLYGTVLRAQTDVLDVIGPGKGCRKMHMIADRVINDAGYAGYFGHGLGHGVGMYIHEFPNLSPRAAMASVLRPGHVVTVEPGIYIGGKYGCRIEDMVLITEDGAYDFTQSPKDLIEIG
jgi:Xaa-Pro aminopeptidase